MNSRVPSGRGTMAWLWCKSIVACLDAAELRGVTAVKSVHGGRARAETEMVVSDPIKGADRQQGLMITSLTGLLCAKILVVLQPLPRAQVFGGERCSSVS